MVNSYYTPSGTPGTGTPGASAAVRSEYVAIQTAFDKLAPLTASAIVGINAGGTAQVALTPTGTGKPVLDTAPVLQSGFTFGTCGRLVSNFNVALADGSFIDIDCTTSGGAFAGDLSVTSSRVSDAQFRTCSAFSVQGRLAVFTSNTNITGNGTSGANTFTVTMPSNGVFRITNTSGSPSNVSAIFIGTTG